MAKKRCSNCIKSIFVRKDKIYVSNKCLATGEKITNIDGYVKAYSVPSDDPYYYKEREKCDEFFPKAEYSEQFISVIDKIRKTLSIGKNVKDIIK